jgi:hypothetical protein
VFADVRAVRCAARIRWAREDLEEVSVQLAQVGREDLLFELTNLCSQLHELHLNVMQPARQLPLLPRPEKRSEQRKVSLSSLFEHVTP